MADTASHTAQQAMDYTRDTTAGVTNTLRQNPMPLALIGAGAAWLWARSRGSSHGRAFARGHQRDYGRDYGAGRTRDEEIYGDGGQADEGDSGMMATIRNNPIPATMAAVGLSWLAFSRGDSNERAYGAQWDDWSGESAATGRSATATGDGGIAQNLTESASQMAARTRAMARRRQSQFQRMVEENPLLVAAGALMLGAAFGMAVPETETENELMGSTRDSMVERARDMARDAANQVQDAAGKIAGREQG